MANTWHSLFLPEVRLMLEDGNTEVMKLFCETLHPNTVSEALTEDVSVEDAWKVLESAGIREQAEIFAYFPIERQVELVEGTGRPHMAKLIEQMSHDDRAALLRELDARVVENLLRLVDEADRKDIKQSLTYEENSVGALMTTDYAWLPAALTSTVALDRLRQIAPDRETIYYIFVLDEPTRKLQGIVSLRDLILAPRTVVLRDLMETNLITLAASDDREKAAQLLAEYDFLALPVVDSENRLLGIVTQDDVIDVINEEATEALQRQGAVEPLSEGYLDVSFFELWRKRVAWLAVLFAVQTLTFSVITANERFLESLPILLFFLPLIISVGGNSGTQAATLLTRALALDEVRLTDWWRVLMRELRMGLALGLTLGILGIIRAGSTGNELLAKSGGPHIIWALTGTVSLAVAVICVWGTIIGAMLPLVLRRCGQDPGFASGPFVASFVDVTGIVIYCGIAKVLFQ